MQQWESLIFLVAGLAIFLIGQRILSQGLQALGGKSVKHIVLKKDQFRSYANFLDGARLAVFAFSPTMSSVVIAGLANSRLLKGPRIIPMLIGTLLGSSVIITILSFETHTRALYLITLGMILGIILKFFKIRSIGKILLGLGLTYLGISIMQDAMRLLITNDIIQHVFVYFKLLDAFPALVLSFCIGCIAALSLMSSTLVLAIVVVLSNLLMISSPFSMGMAFGGVFGSYLMTFFSIRKQATAFAKQRVFTVLLIYCFSLVGVIGSVLFIFESFLLEASPIESSTVGLLILSLITYVLSLILQDPLLEAAKSFYPKQEMKEQAKLKFLGEGRFLTPNMAYVLVEMEVSKLMDIVNRMFLKCEEYLDTNQKPARMLAKIKNYERIIDNIQVEIDIFLEKVISSGAGQDGSKMSINYFKISTSLEQVADSLDKFSTMLTKYYENWTLSDVERLAITSYFDEIYSIYNTSYEVFVDERNKDIDTDKIIRRSIAMKKEIVNLRSIYINTHKESSIQEHHAFSDLVVHLAKMRGRVRDVYVATHQK